VKYKIGQQTDKGRIIGTYLRNIDSQIKNMYLVDDGLIEESELAVSGHSNHDSLPSHKFKINDNTELGKVIGIQIRDGEYFYEILESGELVDFFEEDTTLYSEDYL
jgi:hypothetical protein